MFHWIVVFGFEVADGVSAFGFIRVFRLTGFLNWVFNGGKTGRPMTFGDIDRAFLQDFFDVTRFETALGSTALEYGGFRTVWGRGISGMMFIAGWTIVGFGRISKFRTLAGSWVLGFIVTLGFWRVFGGLLRRIFFRFLAWRVIAWPGGIPWGRGIIALGVSGYILGSHRGVEFSECQR